MTISKFHEKNQVVYFSTTNTNPVVTEALACTSISGDPTRDTGAYQYLGDSTSREEFTFEKDNYVDLQLETLQQVIDPTTSVANLGSIWELFKVCGASIGSETTGSTCICSSNALEVGTYGTALLQKSTPDTVGNDISIQFTDLQGSVDVGASIGEVPTLKFSLKGNTGSIDTAAAERTPDFSAQVGRVSGAALKGTVTSKIIKLDTSDTATLTAAAITGTPVYTCKKGNGRAIITISGATFIDAPKSVFQAKITGLGSSPIIAPAYVLSTTQIVVFHKTLTGADSAATVTDIKKSSAAQTDTGVATLTASNFFGYDYQRFQTSSEKGFSKSAVPTDVSMTVLETNTAGSFNPETDGQKGSFFAVATTITTGSRSVTYFWTKLQLAQTKQGKVGSYLGRDCTFRNTGISAIIHS